MKENGSPEVIATDVNSTANHTGCVNPAATATLFFFYQFILLSDSEDQLNREDVSLYPNPVGNIAKLKSEINFTTATIIDVTGRVMTKSIEDNEFDVSDLSNGLYLIQLNNDQGKNSLIKMIKSN
jgi:hypothetical protein